jgi:microcystin-dependent protein
MKQLYTLLTAVVITASAFLPQQASAQAPEKMSFQAVVRDAGSALVTSTAVGMQLSILEGSATGTAVYVETQTPTTNINGLVSLEIGSGTVVSGSFSSIDWSNGPYFIKTETDPTGGTTYTITGTSQLMSVPYALHANTADSIVGGVSFTEVDGSITNEIQDLQLEGNNLTITNNGSATAVDLSPYLDNTDTQLDSTGIATLGFVAGAHTIDTDTQLDSTDVAGLGFVAGAHTIDTDTQLDSTGIAALGYVAGIHTIISSNTPVNGNLLTFDGTNWISKDIVTGNTGGASSVNNMMPYLTLNYCIALNGIYPSRNISDPFLGTIGLFGFDFTPRGWAQCNGQILAISANSALFSLIGTTYGGDGSTTFALPDLRGRVAIHEGTGAGLTNRSIGERAGSETNTLTTSNLPSHNHSIIIQ